MDEEKIMYNVPGFHCTSFVCNALSGGSTGWGHGGKYNLTSPTALAGLLLGNRWGVDRLFQNNCGKHKGERGNMRVLQEGGN